MDIQAKLPVIYKVKDYHEFEFIKNILDRALMTKVEFENLGCCGDYWGVVYPYGQKPDFLTVLKLVQNYEAKNNHDRKNNLNIAVENDFKYDDNLFDPSALNALEAVEQKEQLRKLHNKKPNKKVVL